MRFFICLVALFALVSCSSFSEKVVSSMDDRNQKPSWAMGGKSMFVKNGKLFAVGQTEVNGDSRISSAMRVADNNARFEISRYVNNTTSFIYQNAEEGVDGGAELSRFYGNELSNFSSNGVTQEDRYWEKVLTFDSEGDRVLKLRIYSLASISQKDVKKAIKRSLEKSKKNLSPEMKKAVDDHMTSQISQMQ